MKKVLYRGCLFEVVSQSKDLSTIQRPDVSPFTVRTNELVDTLSENDIPENIRDKIVRYFKTELPNFSLVSIRRAGEHPDDRSLFMTIAEYRKFPGMFACWTCYNANTNSLFRSLLAS